MTIQLLGKEDQVSDDVISSEEKWSLYVDQFVQLSATENFSLKRRDPFCKRNLPTQVAEDPPVNVETRSGLELKICVNTYKIFFVDNTEDYFRRLRSGMEDKEKNSRKKRHVKFRNWLESDSGWRNSANKNDAVKMESDFESWILGDRTDGITVIKNDGEDYRIV
jgi:paired amphipathic helix protein Sin3a